MVCCPKIISFYGGGKFLNGDVSTGLSVRSYDGSYSRSTVGLVELDYDLITDCFDVSFIVPAHVICQIDYDKNEIYSKTAYGTILTDTIAFYLTPSFLVNAFTEEKFYYTSVKDAISHYFNNVYKSFIQENRTIKVKCEPESYRDVVYSASFNTSFDDFYSLILPYLKKKLLLGW